MKIKGNDIHLDGNDVARAIDLYIASRDVVVVGPRTVLISTGGEAVIARDVAARVYVDPSGKIVDHRKVSDETELVVRGLFAIIDGHIGAVPHGNPNEVIERAAGLAKSIGVDVTPQ